jgi:aryl-alcohol dehydrogenase-like predicted oxidoreductase
VRPPWEDCVTISGPAGEAARAWYLANAMPIFSWSSLAGGFFSGRFRRDNLDGFTDALDRTTAGAYGSEENFRRLDRAQDLAAARGLTVAQVALAYLLNQPLQVYALIGSRTPAEFAENAAAVGVRLLPDELAWLDLRRDEPPA